MGLEGLVSKRRDRPYQAARSKDWLKIKNGKRPSDGAGDGVIQMTTLSKLLAEKEKLIERLQEDVGPEERYEIERLLENVNAALDSLDEARPGPSKGNA